MSKNKRQQPTDLQSNNSVATSIQTAEFFPGPLPHPDQFLKYEQACPGAARDIINMAISQASHRQNLEKIALESKIRNEKQGMNYAFILACLIIISGVIMILFNKDIAGYATLLGASTVLVGMFVYQKKEEKDRIKNLQKSSKSKSLLKPHQSHRPPERRSLA